jgi:3-hydroxyisobutyrate dehydrogenase/2-hydroxy-3-oxopropionate reductase
MGYPMAQHLLAAGHDVALWSHQGAKARELAAKGKGTACESPQQVAERADFIFYCVGDSNMSREVAIGKNGLIEGARKGAIIADCSTISPDVSREIHKAFSDRGVHFLDAPCTGSRPGAEKATLTFMIGGDTAVFEKARPYFEIMGKLFYHCGGPGSGLQAKLTQNLVLGNLFQAFAEGMVLAVKGGIRPELMLEILDNSAAKSGLISFKAPFVLNRDFKPNFSTKWLHKDIDLALESGKDMHVPLPMTSLTSQMLQAAMAKGYAEDDFCATIRILEEWAGVEVRKK